MAVDPEVAKSLNLLRSSPTFVLTERADGSKTVGTLAQIKRDTGVVLLAGETTLANGRTLPAVVEIDTATGETPRAVYWWIDNHWLEPAQPEDRPAMLAALCAIEDDVFPYSWTSRIPLDLG